jgi:phosphotransferase system IIB component
MFLMSLTVLLFVIIVPVVLVLSLVVFLILKNKKGNKKIKIDAEFINNLVDILGGKENVLSVTNENGRIKFELENLEKTNLQGLKELSQSGVFVTNNTVKTLFPHDAKTISNAIKQL